MSSAHLGRLMPWGIGLLGLAAIGCSTPRMAPPADIKSASEVLDAKDRSRASGALVDESFKLGPYSVADVDRDWDSSGGFSVGEYGRKTKTTGYQFKLKGGTKTLAGTCASEKVEQSIVPGLGGGSFSWGDITIGCSCEGDGDKAELLLSKKETWISIDGKKYELAPVHTEEGGGESSDPIGYRADGDGPFAAAEVVHPGRVWIKKGTQAGARAKAACLFAGLMLFKPPSDD